jgi:ABC-type branched-subunit amino acid transport system ATPase component
MMADDVVLRVRRVAKSFGGVRALNDVDMEVARGGVTSIIGPNGAGKSTLFNVLSGFQVPDAGSVVFAGTDVTRLPPESIVRLGLGRTFQTPRPFLGLTALENVMVGAHSRTRSGWIASLLGLPRARAEHAALSETAREWLGFVGLGGVAGSVADALPFPMRRTLEIARVLASSPVLVCLDEPAAGLNSAEIDGLAHLIRRIVDTGITVLLVEHRMELVMSLSSRVIVLNFGAKIADGAPAEVWANSEVVAAYLGKRRRA